MGKILDVFNDNSDEIISRLSENLPKIVNLLQEKGVYKEEETHGLLEDSDNLGIISMFTHMDTGGYYAEFVEALTEARENVVAELVRRKLIFMCMFCRPLFVLFLLAFALSVFFDIQILIIPLVSSNSS
jgi:hypothetical protein